MLGVPGRGRAGHLFIQAILDAADGDSLLALALVTDLYWSRCSDFDRERARRLAARCGMIPTSPPAPPLRRC
jgi:hypothetical protein